MSTRTPENILIVGAQKTGKSTLAKKFISETNRKALIIDSEGLEQLWWDYPIIDVNQLHKFKSGKARVIFNEDDPRFFRTIRENFHDGFLVLDDSAFFLADRRAEHFRKLWMKNRQTNNDVVAIFHGMSEVPPNFWTFVSILALFNTTDSFERSKYGYPEPEKMIKRVYQVRELAKKDRHAKKIFRLR